MRRVVLAVSAVMILSMLAVAAPACRAAHGTYVNSSGHVLLDPKCVTGHPAGETASAGMAR